MKKSKADTILNILLVVAGVVLALGVKFVFHACTGEGMDGMEKSCQRAENAVFAVGLVILALSVVLLFVKKRPLRAVLSLIAAVLGIVAAVIPNHVIPLCQMPDMRCLTVMQPCVILMGILICVLGALDFIVNLRKAK